ncbi:DUF2115 domain-containing protein [Methanofollis aquaemaris]|uniref:UPF0305 protein RJ40_06900 n=1 Tax=Methanofollis aquaemaris TaxID=126734 RepID=A0A8A3S4Q0_9EURY|nr:DUF2115 domain-containing protein [Methanofollis aquaemaris]QSZ67247.1 DUF2115 domain-containing protein [Methanofollis aquaemaris]
MPDAADRIHAAVPRLAACQTRGELGEAIAEELKRYSLFDLQVIGGGMKKEVDPLPEPYRSRARPYFEEQLFGAYHRAMKAYRSGSFRGMDEAIPDRERFERFVALVPDGCLKKEPETDFGLGGALNTLFYYLVTGYAMFVEGGPGHPVGTPFPGGFAVERRGKRYLCPIRDKEEDVPFSICNVCPAEQMEGV